MNKKYKLKDEKGFTYRICIKIKRTKDLCKGLCKKKHLKYIIEKIIDRMSERHSSIR